MQTLALDAIRPNPDQPRKHFDPAPLRELANSIHRNGLMQPIVVRPMGKGFMIVAGERRWRAHKLLADEGRLSPAVIPALVREMDDQDMAIRAIVENLQRQDVTPLEEADAFARLIDQGMTAEDIAEATGAVLFRVRWRLQLLNLAPDIRKLVESENLDKQQALELARLDQRDQHQVLRLINRGQLVGWKAVRNAVDAILNSATQEDIFGDTGKATQADADTLNRMERRIAQVANMIGQGWKDGECVTAAKVNPDRAGHMADQIAATIGALRIMERQLRNTTAQASVLAGRRPRASQAPSRPATPARKRRKTAVSG